MISAFDMNLEHEIDDVSQLALIAIVLRELHFYAVIRKRMLSTAAEQRQLVFST